jgi:hypothetical protein
MLLNIAGRPVFYGVMAGRRFAAVNAGIDEGVTAHGGK